MFKRDRLKIYNSQVFVGQLNSKNGLTYSHHRTTNNVRFFTILIYVTRYFCKHFVWPTSNLFALTIVLPSFLSYHTNQAVLLRTLVIHNNLLIV